MAATEKITQKFIGNFLGNTLDRISQQNNRHVPLDTTDLNVNNNDSNNDNNK